MLSYYLTKIALLFEIIAPAGAEPCDYYDILSIFVLRNHNHYPLRRYILLLAALLPLCAHATIPAIVTLGKAAAKNSGVKHESVGNFLIGVASSFAPKEQRTTFKMLDNIELIESKNATYTPTLISRTRAIINDVGAEYIATHDDGKALNEVYGIKRGEVYTELIILVKSHTDGITSVVALSGEIPPSRLGEIATLERR